MQKITIPFLAVLVFLIFWEAVVWINGWPNYKMASHLTFGLPFGNSSSYFFIMAGILYGVRW